MSAKLINTRGSFLNLNWEHVCHKTETSVVPANMFNVNNKNTKKQYGICLKITTTPEGHHSGHSGLFLVNSVHILHLSLVFNCWLWAEFVYLVWTRSSCLQVFYKALKVSAMVSVFKAILLKREYTADDFLEIVKNFRTATL